MMQYVQRNLIPLTVGLLAVVAIVIVAGTAIVRLTGHDRLSDDEFARELDRRLDGMMRGGSATLGLQLEPDLRVAAVVPGGAGEAAGVKPGDRLIAIEGTEVRTIDDARTRLAAVPANATYTVSVDRQGARLDLKATKGAVMTDLGGLFQRLTERGPFGRPRGDESGAPPAPPPAPGPTLGVSLQPVSGGLRVIGVTPNSPAAGAGMQVDDVIVSANGRATPSVEALQAIVRATPAGGSLPLAVKRGDQQLTLTATFAPRS